MRGGRIVAKAALPRRGRIRAARPADGTAQSNGYHPRVRRTLLRFLTAIQLTRLTMAYGAIADMWLVILITRADPSFADLPASTLPLWVALAAGLVVAVGLFAFGASLNDVLDARHDRAFSPDRPIPAGRIRPHQAAIVTSTCLAAATMGATLFGLPAVITLALVTLGIAFYNGLAKHVPALAFVTIGLVHATHMAIPNHRFGFTLPIWLSMTHAIVIAMLVHRFEEKRPAITPLAIGVTAAGWLFWSVTVLTWGWWHTDGSWPLNTPIWPGVLWPLAAVIGFAVVARLKTRVQSGTVASEKIRRYGAMWQSLYAVAWFAAMGLWKQALMLGGVAAGGFLVMTAIKEFTTLLATPVQYRES
jgi:4-hydroxybenzoate polyprenyltransferase